MRFAFIYIASILAFTKVSAQYNLSIVAGSGVSLGFTGDGAIANNALLYNPYATKVDASGTIFIVDYLNHRIRKVDTLGIITTIAGSGTLPGYSGDGALATNATLNYPTAIAIDVSGNIFIADSKNNCVRKIDANGIITTIAINIGNPTALCIDKNQNIYVVDYLNSQIKKIEPNLTVSVVCGTGTLGYNGDGILAINAQLNYPEGIAVDNAGNLYISDTQNRRIRKVVTDGTIITIAGTGSGGYSGDGALALLAQLNTPKGIDLDTLGNIYFADADNNRIRRIDVHGNINTILGEIGILSSVQLSLPIGVSVDLKGNIYVADTFNSAIRKLTAPASPTEEVLAVQNNTNTNNKQLIIYPNPTFGNLQIVSANADIQSVLVYNMFGQTVEAKINVKENKRIEISIAENASGIYFIHTKTENSTQVNKINLIKR